MAKRDGASAGIKDPPTVAIRTAVSDQFDALLVRRKTDRCPDTAHWSAVIAASEKAAQMVVETSHLQNASHRRKPRMLRSNA